jgi:diguanylate cyclase (GGDEF)-like protein
LALFIIFFCAFSGWGLSGATASPVQRTPGTLPTLTTAAAVHDLTLEDAKRQYPVHLRGVCVVCFADWHGFFLNDGVSGVYVETKDQKLLTSAIHSGTWLEVDGVTGPGEFAPIVDRSTLRILGEKPLPEARTVSIDRLSTGVEDGQWIEFEGTVRSASFRDSMADLVIAAGRLQVEVMTQPGGRPFGSFVDARVRIRGTAGPILNQRGQLIGTHVYTPSLNDIDILEPAPSDPFSVPMEPVRRVFAYTPKTGSDRLVRIRGVVVARWGQTVYINDGAQGASVLGRETNTLQPGDLVDAVGYPALGDAAHTIEDAIFNQLGTAPLPEAKPISVKEALSGDFEGDVVQMEGTLIEQQRAMDQTTLLVSSGSEVFSAVFPVDSNDESLSVVRDGSRIRLTGICVITDTQASRHFRLPKAFEVLLRAPTDVMVIQSPSWWTPNHAFVVVALTLAGMVLVFAWVVALRRRVAQQTQLLRDSEERFRHMALHDNLTGLATRLLFQDRLGVALDSNRRHRTGLAVLMVDVDHFKAINDTHGHQTGDNVLRVTAERLLRAVRREDTVARLGGDEFVVLLPDLNDSRAAVRIAEVLVGTLAVPVRVGDHDVPVSVSIGVCIVADEDMDADILVRNADTALYQAKAGGRNRFAVYKPEMPPPVDPSPEPKGTPGYKRAWGNS